MQSSFFESNNPSLGLLHTLSGKEMTCDGTRLRYPPSLSPDFTYPASVLRDTRIARQAFDRDTSCTHAHVNVHGRDR
jgi:hypothetical protein